MNLSGGNKRRLNVEPKRSQRSGRAGGDDSDAPYNRMDAASPAGNRHPMECGHNNNLAPFVAPTEAVE